MTDEERQKLCKELRRPSFHATEFIRKQAADEIERLAAELEKMGRWYNAAQKQLWAMKEKHGDD